MKKKTCRICNKKLADLNPGDTCFYHGEGFYSDKDGRGRYQLHIPKIMDFEKIIKEHAIND